MGNSEEIWRLVDARKGPFEALSDRIWGMPELQYAERRSVAEHTQELEREGFRVARELAGIPTAVMGEDGGQGRIPAVPPAWPCSREAGSWCDRELITLRDGRIGRCNA